MSLSEVSPLINEWIKKGLKWHYIFQPVVRPFTIPANGEVQIPSGKVTFRAKEGVLIDSFAAFDSPKCGVRLQCYPNIDTKDFFVVEKMIALGNTNLVTPFFSTVPPQSPTGIYVLGNLKEWAWKEWLRIYVLNTDSVPHRCLFYAYTIAMLEGKE